MVPLLGCGSFWNRLHHSIYTTTASTEEIPDTKKPDKLHTGPCEHKPQQKYDDIGGPEHRVPIL